MKLDLTTSPEPPHAARHLVEVALTLTDACLDALDVAFRLEHPMLDHRHALDDPTTLRRARAVICFAAALRGALHAYRKAVHRGRHDSPSDDQKFRSAR